MKHTAEDLLKLSRTEKNARKRIRLLALSHFLECKNRTLVANSLKISRTSVNKWVTQYLELGLDGLEARKAKGRAPFLSANQQKQLGDYIEKQSHNESGGRLTGEKILNYIKAEFGVHYHPNAIYKLLSQLGFSWITSRSRHPKQKQSVQDAYIKLPTGNDPSHPRNGGVGSS
jgi:transposase